MKIAVIHDWLVTYAGAERVLEQILICFPDAEIFSLIDFIQNDQREFLQGKTVKTSFMQNLPGVRKYYRNYLPLMPFAIEQFDLSAYDLIISSSHAVAKGVIVGPDQLHICVCYSPIRYAWDLYHQYLNESGLAYGCKALIVKIILHYMRFWDVRSANSVDHFIAISHFVSRRIYKIYRRESTVIYPPVDSEKFKYSQDKEEFYLTASRMVPYKSIPLIVEAFAKMPDKQLIVIGDGPDFDRCKRVASKNIKLLGWQSSEILSMHMQKAKAFIFAAEEDFGIAPLEAQSCGTPVIALKKGALLETVRDISDATPTGVLFEDKNTDSIISAVNRFEQLNTQILSQDCRDNAKRFGPEIFRRQFVSFVENKYRSFRQHCIDSQ